MMRMFGLYNFSHLFFKQLTNLLRLSIVAIFMVYALCIPNLVYAQGKNPFYVEIIVPKLQKTTANTIDVIFVVPSEHHLYRDMMVVNVTSSKQISAENSNPPKKNDKNAKTSNTVATSLIEIGEPIFEEGVFVQDPANPIDLRELYKNTTKIQIPITGHEVGNYEIQLYIRYQGCKKTLCYMPQYEDHVIVVTVSNK